MVLEMIVTKSWMTMISTFARGDKTDIIASLLSYSLLALDNNDTCMFLK